jgi:hypothetical protein
VYLEHATEFSRSGFDATHRAGDAETPDRPIVFSIATTAVTGPYGPVDLHVGATIGLIGAPLLLAATVATLFGHIEQFSTVAALAALPVAAWELSLGIYLVVKGFKPSPITT